MHYEEARSQGRVSPEKNAIGDARKRTHCPSAQSGTSSNREYKEYMQEEMCVCV